MKFRLEGLKDLAQLVKELANGLRNLDFSNNFNGFQTTVSNDPTVSQDIKIRNELTFIPTKYIILSQEGNALITKHATNEWTSDYLYLYNNDASNAVTITVLFLK